MLPWPESSPVRASLLLHELPLFAFRPRIVLQYILQTVRDRRMIVRPEDEQPAGIGIVKAVFAERLKSLGGGLVRIGNDAVNHFHSILVRLVLEVPAVRAADRSHEEREQH